MNILIRRSSLILLFALTFPYFEPTIARTAFREGKNFGFLERITCRAYSPNVSIVSCLAKYIDRNNVRGHLAMELRHPLSAAWVHGVIYYKYFTYEKIATEYWDDLCAWVAGGRNSFLLDFLKPLIMKYTNFNHSCPYTGLVFGKVDNISAQEFTLPQIIPAGRYKVDFNLTEGDRKTALAGLTLYGSISDHRIEVV